MAGSQRGFERRGFFKQASASLLLMMLQSDEEKMVNSVQ
jgi:hypothetical protein